jgi:hypothetical protein
MMLDRSRQRRVANAWALAALFAALAAVALGLSCAGPLPDTCDELRTCALVDAGLVDAGDDRARGVDAVADGAADVAMDTFVCDPTKDPKDEPCVLDDAHGVFVASPQGVDGGMDAGDGGATPVSGDGSMSRPYATIGQALANLGNKARIYVCNGSYGEQVTITTAVRVYGGLSCPAGATGGIWTYVGGTAHVTSPSSAPALSVTGVSSGAVAIEDVSFTSPNATGAGTSSIAALVTSSSVSLVRVTLSAGDGANGAAGADGAAKPNENYVGLAADGGAQVWGSPGGLFGPISGGAGGVNRCLQFGSSAGGDGGLGCNPTASSPGLGMPGTADPAAPTTQAGRDGLPAGAVLPIDGSVAVINTNNDPGADGLAGDGGAAAPAQVYGTLSASGWAASAGGDGTAGNPGQGGAGATDPLYGSCSSPTQTIGGGGGGAGGCGGAGGKGGSGGGASIALASLNSTIDLRDCTLVAAAGGTGGAGGAGQDGQAGGAGGDDNSFQSAHAAGAAGGNGAGGSGGAGGTGGISVGVLYVGSMITSDTATSQKTTLGGAGAGGAAGPAGKHPTGGVLMTGVDGNPGALGSPGTFMALLRLM